VIECTALKCALFAWRSVLRKKYLLTAFEYERALERHSDIVAGCKEELHG